MTVNKHKKERKTVVIIHIEITKRKKKNVINNIRENRRIKNGQSRDTDNIEDTRHRTKPKKTPKKPPKKQKANRQTTQHSIET